MARTTNDIKARIHGGAVFDRPPGDPRSTGPRSDPWLNPQPLSVMEVAEMNNRFASFAGNGYWNDPDMLVTGNQGLTQDEQKAHFALWCVMSSPLILGNDPRVMTTEEKDIILNREAIAINQDPTEQGRRIKSVGDVEVWTKKLKANRIGVLLLNRNATQVKPITVAWSDIGIGGKVQVTDVYTSKELGVFETSLTLDTRPHAGWFLLLSVNSAQ